jgi:Domain of unknown function (DUF3854)/Origin of replication binding protein
MIALYPVPPTIEADQTFTSSAAAAPINSLDMAPIGPIHPAHWQEWLDSGISPALIEANVVSLEGDTIYDYLCTAEGLDRNAIGRLATPLVQRYDHATAGGWWCSGLDPLNHWQPMEWGCFKPDQPRTDPTRGKTIKYEHPPKTGTRAFFLNGPADGPGGLAFWQQVLADPQHPILLVEGAKKAAALLSLGYAAIALPGVFNGRRVMRNQAGQAWAESLIPELALFAQPDRPVYFCFDQDAKPTTVRQVNLAIKTTGKLFVEQGCAVRVITLPGPEKGVDDFLVMQGEEARSAFKNLYQNALTLSLWQWQWDQKSALTLPALITCNQAQFDPWNVGPDAPPLPDEGILVLASPKGTGKTQAISRLVQTGDRVMALGHRIALMRNLCERMDLDYCNDLDAFEGKCFNADGFTQRIGLCVDSLTRIDPDQFAGGVLVIDEFMQVLRHLLTSSTCNQNGKRPMLLARFGQVIRAARLVILADADAADIGIQYIQALKGEQTPIGLVHNTHIPPGFPIRFLEARTDTTIVQELLNDLRQGKKILIATDSIDSAEAIASLMTTQSGPSTEPNPLAALRGLVINSKTSGELAQRQFITQPNREVHQYDWIMATPSLTTGVSLEVDHFDCVYGLFYGIYTDADASQALSRVRAKVPRTVWCHKQGKNFHPFSKSSHPQVIERTLKVRSDLSALLLRNSLGSPETLLPALAALVWDQNPHLKLFTQLAAETNGAMWSLRDRLQARLHFEGNTLEIVKIDDEQTPPSPVSQARKQVKQNYYAAIAHAQLLNPSQRAELEHQASLSQAHKLSLEKTLVAEFLQLGEVTAADVEFYVKYRSGLIQLETLRGGRNLAVERDLAAMNRQAQWNHGILPFDQPCFELQRCFREQLGLLPFLVPGQTWNDQDLEPIGNAVRHHRQNIKTALGFTVSKDKHATNGWIYQILCQQLGLKVRSQRLGSRNQQVRCFHLDPDHYAIVEAVLARRALARTSQSQRFTAETPDQSLAVDHTTATAVVTPSGLNLKGQGDYRKPPQNLTENNFYAIPQEVLSKGIESIVSAIITPVQLAIKLAIFKPIETQLTQLHQRFSLAPAAQSIPVNAPT